MTLKHLDSLAVGSKANHCYSQEASWTGSSVLLSVGNRIFKDELCLPQWQILPMGSCVQTFQVGLTSSTPLSSWKSWDEKRLFSFLVKRVKSFLMYIESHFKPVPIPPKLGRLGYSFDCFPKLYHTGNTAQTYPCFKLKSQSINPPWSHMSRLVYLFASSSLQDGMILFPVSNCESEEAFFSLVLES